MKCPRCSGQILPGKFKTIPMHKCNFCDGMLILQSNLLQILVRLNMDLSLSISLDSHIELIENKHGVCKCPSCHEVMNSFGYMGSNYVIIDNCIHCNLLWVDALELGAMALLYARTEKRSQYRELQSLSRQSDLLTEHLVRQAIIEAFILENL